MVTLISVIISLSIFFGLFFFFLRPKKSQEINELTATKVLEMFIDIPRKEFIVGKFTNEKDACCSVGHLNRLLSDNPNDYSWSNCSGLNNPKGRDIVDEFIRKTYEFVRNGSIISVNDGYNTKYKQADPKTRVISLLIDMAGKEIKDDVDEILLRNAQGREANKQ